MYISTFIILCQLLSNDFIFGSVVKNAPNADCCQTKMVGPYSYTLVESSTEVPAICKDRCVYQRDGMHGSEFCFKTGDLPSHCGSNFFQSNVVFAKNLDNCFHCQLCIGCLLQSHAGCVDPCVNDKSGSCYACVKEFAPDCSLLCGFGGIGPNSTYVANPDDYEVPAAENCFPNDACPPLDGVRIIHQDYSDITQQGTYQDCWKRCQDKNGDKKCFAWTYAYGRIGTKGWCYLYDSRPVCYNTVYMDGWRSGQPFCP